MSILGIGVRVVFEGEIADSARYAPHFTEECNTVSYTQASCRRGIHIPLSCAHLSC